MASLKNIFKTIFGRPQGRYFIYHVKCNRCGEIIEARVDTANDLSVEYERGGDVYYVRKVLMGDGKNHCYEQIEVGLKFNRNRYLLDKTISGGELLDFKSTEK